MVLCVMLVARGQEGCSRDGRGGWVGTGGGTAGQELFYGREGGVHCVVGRGFVCPCRSFELQAGDYRIRFWLLLVL